VREALVAEAQWVEVAWAAAVEQALAVAWAEAEPVEALAI
jgi:hypothetical protein